MQTTTEKKHTLDGNGNVRSDGGNIGNAIFYENCNILLVCPQWGCCFFFFIFSTRTMTIIRFLSPSFWLNVINVYVFIIFQENVAWGIRKKTFSTTTTTKLCNFVYFGFKMGYGIRSGRTVLYFFTISKCVTLGILTLCEEDDYAQTTNSYKMLSNLLSNRIHQTTTTKLEVLFDWELNSGSNIIQYTVNGNSTFWSGVRQRREKNS